MRRLPIVHVDDHLRVALNIRYGGRYATSTIHWRRGRVAWFARDPLVSRPGPIATADINGNAPE